MMTSSEAPRGGPLRRLGSSLHERPRLLRELILFGLMTLFGLIVMPFLIWFASSRVLGPYTHGQDLHAGPFALLADYYTGLVHGSAVFWSVALGPAVMILLMRLFLAAWRALPAAGRR